ncbi:hypothetical protein QBC46DRAFT_412345 [Diplogelasinospora grovesii]|uniref:Cyclochlorotine biosynthesis protein O n=1 Tax=Diplogelasinospora grovesii TaxID=303347 RepID=A0AAN6S020_9PEZI|nr:hypothetical protein QBC46DRAFT_412345 [Diplogelasinospora grovesii]
MAFRTKALYGLLPQRDSSSASSESNTKESSRWNRFRYYPIFSYGSLVLTHVVIWLVVYVPLAVYIYSSASSSAAGPSWQACDVKRETWSPALGSIKYKPPAHFDGEISQVNRFRGPPGAPPTAEIDAAWKDIGLGAPGIRLTQEDLEVLNKTFLPRGRYLHRIPEEHGGGYLGLLEVFHLLHCLDSLREAMFYNWQYYNQNVSREAVVIHHVSRVGSLAASQANEETDHCIEALRMSIMCTSDVTPITFFDSEALPGRKYPLPDFSSKHVCRDFDAVLDWSWKNPRAVMWEDIGDAVTFKGQQQPYQPR